MFVGKCKQQQQQQQKINKPNLNGYFTHVNKKIFITNMLKYYISNILLLNKQQKRVILILKKVYNYK